MTVRNSGGRKPKTTTRKDDAEIFFFFGPSKTTKLCIDRRCVMRSADSFCLFCTPLSALLSVFSRLFFPFVLLEKFDFEWARKCDWRPSLFLFARWSTLRHARRTTTVSHEKAFRISFSDKFPKENIERCRRKKKGEKDKTSRIVNCRTHDRWGPESRNLQSRSSGKKEAWVSFVVAKTHTLLAIKLISPTARSPKLFYRFLPRQTPRTR